MSMCHNPKKAEPLDRIAHNSVSIPGLWAVARPDGQLASLRLGMVGNIREFRPFSEIQNSDPCHECESSFHMTPSQHEISCHFNSHLISFPLHSLLKKGQ